MVGRTMGKKRLDSAIVAPHDSQAGMRSIYLRTPPGRVGSGHKMGGIGRAAGL
jgi:hypothetical protein